MAVEAIPSSTNVWQMTPGDPAYPEGLDQKDNLWASLQAIGNRDILKRPAVGLVCSVQCPGSVVIKTFDAIREP